MSAPLFRLRGGFNSGVSYEEEDGSSADESFDSNEIVFKDPNVQKDFERFCSNGVISHIDSELEGKLKADNSSTADADDSRWQGNHTSVMGAANMTRKDSASMHLRGGTRSKARPGASGVKKQQGREQISISFIGSILQSLRGVTTLFSRRKPLQEEAGNERASGRGQGECESRYAEDSKASLPETRSSLIKKGRKQNCLIFVGYLGTNFSGSQILIKPTTAVKRISRKVSSDDMMQDASEGEGEQVSNGDLVRPTVEQELIEACYQAGLITMLTSDTPMKLTLSRASRTDKGVHAAFNTLSIKLLLNHSSAKDEPEDAQWEVTERLNQVSEARGHAVKILAVLRAPKRCRARSVCSLRTYEYLLPCWLLGGEVDHLNRLLKKFAGNKAFINFAGRDVGFDSLFQLNQSRTRIDPTADVELSAKEHFNTGNDVRMELDSLMENTSTTVNGSRVDDMEVDLEAASNATVPGPQPLQSNISDDNFSIAESQTFPKRSVMESKRIIYRCQAEPIALELNDGKATTPFVKIEICGTSFMFHQIRKMVGLCLAIINGSIPEIYLDLALQGDYRLPCPLAPSSGLILTNMSFWDERIERFRADLPEEVMRRSLAYKQRVVYPHIAALFEEGGKGEAEFQSFYAGLGRFCDAVTLQQKVNMSQLLGRLEAKRLARSVQGKGGHCRNVSQAEFVANHTRQDLGKSSPAGKNRHERASLIQNVVKQRIRASGSVYPRGTMNQVCFKYGLQPGPLLNEIRREILRAVSVGLLPVTKYDMSPFLLHAKRYLETKGMLGG